MQASPDVACRDGTIGARIGRDGSGNAGITRRCLQRRRSPGRTEVARRRRRGRGRLCTLAILFGRGFVRWASRRGRLCTLATPFGAGFVHRSRPVLYKVPVERPSQCAKSRRARHLSGSADTRRPCLQSRTHKPGKLPPCVRNSRHEATLPANLDKCPPRVSIPKA